ncbi:MAG TPA: phosphate ABC transporter permease subunit PstC [Gaiellales bacterium]|nr:phosphate ABC transporter permease subunit PstC [Gaiellales bacterium]
MSAASHRAGVREAQALHKQRLRLGDASFRVIVAGAALLIVLAFAATAFFLVKEAWPSLRHYGPVSFLDSTRWAPSEAIATKSDPNPYGVLQFVYGTVLTSFIAMLLAVPVAVGLALYITDVAPVRLRKPLAYLVDLFAAIPSVVYGFWGIFALLPALHPIADHLISWLGGIPVIGAVFAGPFFGPSYFAAGIVLSIMVLPIITAICREVFAVAPVAEKEAALALGATRWEMLRMSVLKRSTAGIFGASLLGLGRAFGETIAVTMLIGNSVLAIATSIFGQGATMPSVIVNEFTEATEPFHLDSLFVVGTLLLIITLIVNVIGKLVVSRISETIA